MTNMAHKTDPSAKVSPALAATLAGLPDRAVVRVLLLLDLPAHSVTRRLTPQERAKTLADTRAATETLLERLRPTIEAAGAVRVDDGAPTALGGVVLDVPAAGVPHLAQAEEVRSILGDQPLAPPDSAPPLKLP
jgi:hypothetical protein